MIKSDVQAYCADSVVLVVINPIAFLLNIVGFFFFLLTVVKSAII